MGYTMALIVRKLRKSYGTQVALRDVDLTLHEGVVALLGANGSGKSTLMRTLATLTKPDSGEVSLDGHDYTQHERQLRAQIGYLPQDFEVPEMFTPRKLLAYLANLRGGNVDEVLTSLHLEALADQQIRQLSGGQIRLVGVAQALLGKPHLMLLDELAHGLDFIERERVFRVVAQLCKLVIFSTHIPDDAARIAQTGVVLHQGRVLFCGALDDLRTSAAGEVYEMCAASEALPQLVDSLVVSRVTLQGSSVLLRVIGKPPCDAVVVEPSLEDAYLWLLRQ
jgi:ABC-2 type transport system ATP-binding protein